jgi:excisionase family DNA binding protein
MTGLVLTLDVATAAALEEAIRRQLEIHEIAPSQARITPGLVEIRKVALSVVDRQEPSRTDSRGGVMERDRMDREWLSVAEFAAELGVSRRTVERRIAAGELRSRKFGACRRVLAADLDPEEAA